MSKWLVVLLLLLPFCADAQSVPNGGAITPGQVWTPEQWTTAWKSKLDTTSSGGTFNNPTINGGTLTNGTINSPTVSGGVISGITSTNGVFNNPTINGGAVSSSNAIATGSLTSRTLANRFGQIINVKDYGALGNGVADDSAAFVAAINQENAYSAAGTPAAIYIPGGQYLIAANTLPTMTRGGAVFGDGTHKTYVIIGLAYSGDLFSWSESWMATDYNGTTLNPAADKAGPILQGITIVGNTTATTQQNAIEFYDRDDFVNVSDVDVYFVHGQCLGMGKTKSMSQGYVRESSFADVTCFNTGLSNVPAVSVSSTTTSISDATNEVKFFRLQIFSSAGVGLSITNPNSFNNTRLIEFFAPRVEFSAGDNIQVGSQTDAGGINSINFYGLESITPGQSNSGFFALNLDTSGPQMYGVGVFGATLGPCWQSATCKGLNVGNVRLSQLHMTNIAVAGTSVTYTANAGASIVLDNGNGEQGWSYSLSAPSKVATPLYRYGNPTVVDGTAGTFAVAAGYHDGSSTYGSSPGRGAVDLQIVRNNAAQSAAVANSALVAGSFNQIVGNGSGAAIVGGTTNTAGGASSFIGGGQQATDRSRSQSQAFAAGMFSTVGDAQSAHFVLSATCASCSSQQLATNHGTPSSINIANISANQSYAMTWRCVARDVTTAGTDIATTMPIMLLTRDATIGTTAVVNGTAANASRGTWTGGGFAFTADTTNGGPNIAFTSPTGNTDTFHAVCEGHDAEVQ